MKAATLFSGIGAPECAMPSWDWIWHAEIENFPSAVMEVRHPTSVNLGDVNAEDFIARAERIGRPDVLVFGSPCQSFSVAGKRLGLDDARGNLALVALGIVKRLGPKWFCFENVPGLFSSYSGSDEASGALRGDGAAAGYIIRRSDGGIRGDDEPVEPGDWVECDEDSDFAVFLSAVRECGYLGCYRVFDAQYSGVPQRRRRIFFVGHLGDWRPPVAVLLEPDSLRGDSPPSREAREGVATAVETSVERSRIGEGLVTDAIPICESGKRASVKASPKNGIGIGQPGDPSFTLGTDSRHAVVPPLNSGMGKRRGSGAHGDPMVTGAVSAKWSKGTGGPAGDECYNLVAADVADPIHTNEMRCVSHAGNNPRPRNLVAVAFEPNQITSPHNRSQPSDLAAMSAARPDAIAFQTRVARNGRGGADDVVPALNGSDAGATSDMRPCVAVFKPSHFTRGKDGAPDDLSPPLSADADKGDQDPVLMSGAAVRRLTPTECERLQAYPDDYTLITYRGKPAADGPRYRSLGNSMNVKDVRAILQRIETFERVTGAK